MSLKSPQSRRDFLKETTIFGVGSVAINNRFIQFFANTNVPWLSGGSFLSFELIRASDLLHLKYFFYNAKVVGNYLVPEKDEYPMFVYIQLPPQHIAEELLDPRTITQRSSFTGRQPSFLAANSILAFKLITRDKKLLRSPESFLNWSDNFQLVTMDDFAVRDGATIAQYRGAIDRLKDEFAELRTKNPDNFRTWHQNFGNNQNVPWPITKFELPYKMFLSPIAQPSTENAGEFIRQYGNYEFLGDNSAINVEYTSDSGGLRIIAPWETRLVFRNNENQVFDPRLKVVHWLCQRNSDNDQKSELLPAPIHRDELHGLTMRPDFDRDVLSTLVTISALGGNAALKYKNDDPGEYSLVAWEQKIKYARDNYVSVTFRAVDVFTGIKLLISIIAERDYKFGVSFLPKFYYVSYAEKEKNYTAPVTISKVPFVKIIPKTKGAYFFPAVVQGTSNAYHVTSRDPYNGANLDCNALLSFDYVGIDKAGKEHPFQAKIIFIPAESYRITSGTYTYQPRVGAARSYTANSIVDINHIGLLNPSRQEKYQASPRALPCPGSTTDTYWFKLEKSFDAGNKNALKTTLDAVRLHINNNKACYSMDIFADVTFAKIDALKQDRQMPVANKVVTKSLIRKDSTNATFHTRDILMQSAVNEKLYQPGRTVTDNFLDPDPLMVFMEESNVIISQVDQLEGKSQFRGVRFAAAYSESEQELDKDNPKNQARLLFKLKERLPDFFSKNYKSAGAVVNPGIDISCVSVLDQSVAYNESHNETGPGAASDVDVNIGMVKSSSIFGNIKAEILGIPLTSIIEEYLPVEDLPVLAYVQQAEQSVERLQEMANKYKSIAATWVKEYKDLKATIEASVAQLQQLEGRLKNLGENMIRAWLDSMIEQSGARDYYNALQASLTELKTEYANYVTSIVKPISDELKKKLNLDPQLAAVASAASEQQLITAVTALVQAAKQTKDYTPQYLKEVAKYYVINALTTNPAINKTFIQAIELKDSINSLYYDYFNAFTEGYKEATLFVQNILQEQANKLQQQVSEAKAYVNKAIISKLPEKFIEKELDWILTLHQIAKTYSYYHEIYENLHRLDYRKLAAELKIALREDAINSLEGALIKRLRKQVDAIEILAIQTTDDHKQQLSQFKSFVVAKLAKDKDWLSNYTTEFKDAFEERLNKELEPYLAVVVKLDKEYEEVKSKYLAAKELYDKRERIARDFVHYKIEETKKLIESEKQKLLKEARGTKAYSDIMEVIANLQAIIKAVQEISRQRLEYTYTTRKFRPATLGGAIEFKPNNTEMTVRVFYDIEFDISQFDRPPVIAKQSFVTDSTITNFKIGLLQLLYIDFLQVRFVTGSDVKDDFQVRIRDVQFAGCLSFVQAFQQFLSTISDNLVFDIDASGARIGYGFSIPDFSAGYFNFFNFNLSALLTLPFDPKEAMQLRFGFGTPLNKFGLTVSGIFGGQGYFNLIAEPRRGIVGMEMALEFGAILKLNLVVASGTAYLVGGVYIRRYASNYQINAYILAVGRFNVLGLFSASITFYLALEGDGNVLEGVCQVKVSKRFSKFFEISVSCEMRKTLKGAKTGNNSRTERAISDSNSASLAAAGITVEDSNLHKSRFYDDESLYLVLSSKTTDALQFKVSAPPGAAADASTVVAARKEGYAEKLFVFRKKLTDYSSPGKYTLNVESNGTVLLSRSFYVENAAAESCRPTQPRASINDREYYASYYLKSNPCS